MLKLIQNKMMEAIKAAKKTNFGFQIKKIKCSSLKVLMA
jgi:hypothetical protein